MSGGPLDGIGILLERAAVGKGADSPDRAVVVRDLVGLLTVAMKAAAEEAVRTQLRPNPAPPVVAATRPRSWRFEIRRDGGLITEIIAHPEEPQP